MRPPWAIRSIAPARASDRFFSGTISLVDVRGDREHATVRVPCATHIPLAQLLRRVDQIRADRPVALLCRSGHRSALATLIARRHGLDAMSVAGGMRAWLSAERPAVWLRQMTPEKRAKALASRARSRLRGLRRASGDQANHGARPVVVADSLEPANPHDGRRPLPTMGRRK
jgi:rhodanese-related sulfurtransferase